MLFYGIIENAGGDLEKVMKSFFKEKLNTDSDRVDKMKFLPPGYNMKDIVKSSKIYGDGSDSPKQRWR